MTEKKQFPSDEADKYLVRFAEAGMREKLKALAKKSGRKTLTAEINAALIAHIAADGKALAPSAGIEFSEAAMKHMAEMVAQRLFELQSQTRAL